jgi:hypothetical protein
VRVVTKGVAAPNVDMIALWPDATDPTHLIFCNEQGVTDPGVQRLDLATGEVDTIVTGTDACDPLHVTPWGSIVFGEEAGGGSAGGRVYELVDPLHTTNVLLDRTTGVFTDGAGGEGAENVVARPALGRLSFEGVGFLPNGVVYYGDENRPNVGNAGGSYFTFIPGTLRNPNADPITSLDESPLVGGTVYGLRLGKRSGNTDYGWGAETGLGVWVQVANSPDADLRALAATAKLTAYYPAGGPRVRRCRARRRQGEAVRQQHRQRVQWPHLRQHDLHHRRDGVAGRHQHGHARGAAARRGQPAARHDGQHRAPARPRELGDPRGRRQHVDRVATTTCGCAYRTGRTPTSSPTAASGSPP